MQNFGKTVWMIPDCYWPVADAAQANQPYQSHEALCILNTGDADATLRVTLYFEDEEPWENFIAMCPARRTHHVRMNTLYSPEGRQLPQGKPYAALIVSDIPVVVQYSRLDATQANNALMTTLAYAGGEIGFDL